jgi:hypothetical protein
MHRLLGESGEDQGADPTSPERRTSSAKLVEQQARKPRPAGLWTAGAVTAVTAGTAEWISHAKDLSRAHYCAPSRYIVMERLVKSSC